MCKYGGAILSIIVYCTVYIYKQWRVACLLQHFMRSDAVQYQLLLLHHFIDQACAITLHHHIHRSPYHIHYTHAN